MGHTEDYNNTHRAWHNEVRLRIKVATKYIIAMTFQSLETFSLWSNNKGDTFEENLLVKCYRAKRWVTSHTWVICVFHRSYTSIIVQSNHCPICTYGTGQNYVQVKFFKSRLIVNNGLETKEIENQPNCKFKKILVTWI